jgi:hypothetical protein
MSPLFIGVQALQRGNAEVLCVRGHITITRVAFNLACSFFDQTVVLGHIFRHQSLNEFAASGRRNQTVETVENVTVNGVEGALGHCRVLLYDVLLHGVHCSRMQGGLQVRPDVWICAGTRVEMQEIARPMVIMTNDGADYGVGGGLVKGVQKRSQSKGGVPFCPFFLSP